MKKLISATIFLLICVFSLNIQAEAKKKPTITYQLTQTNWTRSSVRVNVSAKGKGGIKSLLWQRGKIKKTKAKYWYGSKSIKKKKYFKAPENGWYSVKAVDKKGGSKVVCLKVSNIDKTGPTGTWSYNVKNKVATVTINASDPRGVSSMKWQTGYITKTGIGNFSGNVTNNQFTVNQQGYCTVRVADTLGNVKLVHIWVRLWQDLYELKAFDYTSDVAWDKTKKDRFGNEYSRAISIGDDCYVEYYLNGAYKYLSTDIFRPYSHNTDEVKTWIRIYADDVCIYSGEKFDYKTQKKSITLDIRNAKYLKIEAYKSVGYYGTMCLVNAQLYN